jgi:predicted aspartyl protease
MILGNVNRRLRLIIPLRICGPGGESLDKDAVIDTLFDGALTLPESVAVFLRLPYRGPRMLRLGHGRAHAFKSYAATVIWMGERREVLTYAAPGDVTVGLPLLRAHLVMFTLVPGGEVSIWPPSEIQTADVPTR